MVEKLLGMEELTAKILTQMDKFRVLSSTARVQNGQTIAHADAFAKSSFLPYQRKEKFNIAGQYALSPGAYTIPAKSGMGKSTAGLAVAVAIAISFAADEDNKYPKREEMVELLEDMKRYSTTTKFAELVKIFFEKHSKVLDEVTWMSINEPMTRRITVIDLLAKLGDCASPIILVDSINDILQQYQRIFREPAQQGGWKYSQLEFISSLNDFAESMKKVLIVTLNTDFTGLHTMLGRTEGEIYPLGRESFVEVSSRLKGRVNKKLNLSFTAAIAMSILEGSHALESSTSLMSTRWQ